MESVTNWDKEEELNNIFKSIFEEKFYILILKFVREEPLSYNNQYCNLK